MSNQQDMKQKNPNVPNLRFNQDPWFPISIGSLFSPIRNGFVGIATPFYTTADKGVRYLQSTNIHDGHITNDTKVFVTKDFHTAHPKSVLKSDDIVMVQSGHSGECAVVGNEYAGCNCHALIIMSNVGASDSRFISFLLNGPVGRNKTRVLLTGNTVKHILASDMKAVSVNAPSLETQIKIADFLELIDKRIEVQNKILEDLFTLKRGIIHSVIWNNEWAKVSLGNLLKERTEKTKKQDQYTVLSSASTGLFTQEEYFSHQVASANNVGYKVVKKGDIILSPQNLWLGNINYNDKFEVGMVSPSYKVFEVTGCNAAYLSLFLHTKRMKYLYGLCSEQGASVVRRNLNLDEFLEITIPMPTIVVQESVAKKLGNIEFKIKSEQRMLELFQSQKRFLLNSLFI